MAELDTDTDPRHKGFSGFALRPAPQPPAETSEPLPPRRGIAGAPPPKPTLTTPDLPPAREENVPPVPTAAIAAPLDLLRETTGPATPLSRGERQPKEPTGPRPLGVPRHHMRYVQFQVSPVISDLLTTRAQAEDLVLGEVVMDALRHLEAHPAPGSSGRRRRRAGTSARRSILVRPQEADEIRSMAERLGYTPSGLIRNALEHYLL